MKHPRTNEQVRKAWNENQDSDKESEEGNEDDKTDDEQELNNNQTQECAMPQISGEQCGTQGSQCEM